MKILIVEDSPKDRELLKYLLAARFQHEAKFREAASLKLAVSYLRQGDIDCAILDLSLPDSAGKETFQKIITQFPQVPIIVMTNTNDRNLAVDMIRQGAADYILKNFTNEEELFQRVLFAIEKHQRTIAVPPEEAATVRQLEKAQASMLTAANSGEHEAIQTTTAKTTDVIATLSRRMFSEIQKINITHTRLGTQQDHLVTTVDTLQRELLQGYPTQPSIKNQISLIIKRVDDLEDDRKSDIALETEKQKYKLDRNTRIVLAVLGILGALTTALLSAYVTTRVMKATPTEVILHE